MREEWTEARIDELGNGRRPVLKAGPFGSSVTKATYITSGYKVYGQQEVVAKDLNAEAYFVSETTFSRHKSCAVKPGDILMTMMGTIGRVYRVPEGAPEGIINPRLVRLAFDTSRILPEYAEVALEQPPLQRLLDRRSHGGTMQGLNLEALASVRLPLPPLPEQRKIAEILRTWDTAIQKAEQLIAAKERHYSHELSRLISRGQHAHTHVGTFAEEVSARNRGGNEARVLSVTNSRGFVLPEDQFERRVASADLSNYKVVRRGQYAYNPSRINVGSIARLDGWEDGVLSPMYVVLRLDESKTNSDYFLHWLNSHEARQRIKNSAQGSVRETVSFSEFAAITIPLPDTNTQTAIARCLNALREEIDLLGQTVAALKTQKRGLMQKLLTGQWRLPVQEEAN
jgi:type I restriction enzyme S subunit